MIGRFQQSERAHVPLQTVLDELQVEVMLLFPLIPPHRQPSTETTLNVQSYRVLYTKFQSHAAIPYQLRDLTKYHSTLIISQFMEQSVTYFQ
eukprot:969053-Amorphochlora_amoeboformis.AAC.1